MTAKNDITGDSIKTKGNSKAFRESPFWDNIEKKKKEAAQEIDPSSAEAQLKTCKEIQQ